MQIFLFCPILPFSIAKLYFSPSIFISINITFRSKFFVKWKSYDKRTFLKQDFERT